MGNNAKPRVISYGEDPLTYEILTSRLNELLKALSDNSKPEEALVIYRPSFGRGAGACFGEFDGIVATKNAIYLIESKWHRSSEISGSIITIRDTQVMRHRKFRWYLDNWNSADEKWDSFVIQHGNNFQKVFQSSLPSSDSTLSKNIEFLLVQLMPYNSTNIVDVLLFVHARGINCPNKVNEKKFKLVCMEYNGINDTDYFEMGLKNNK